MKKIACATGIVAVMAGWASARSSPEEYAMVLEPPNGDRIPKTEFFQCLNKWERRFNG